MKNSVDPDQLASDHTVFKEDYPDSADQGLNCDLRSKWNVVGNLELVWGKIFNIDHPV